MLVKRKSQIAWVAAFVLGCLAACGGGGGGGGGSGTSPSATLAVSPSTVSVQGVTTDGIAPNATITVTVTNPAGNDVYVGWQYSQSGIETADLQQTASGIGTVSLVFKNPSSLGPGTYTDTVQIGLCTDASCNAVTPGSMHTVSITYKVTGATMSASWSPQVVSVQALPFIDVPPQSPIVVVPEGVPLSMVSVTTTTTTSGMWGATVNSDGDGHYIVDPIFKAPNTLAPGNYDDTVTISVCYLSTCPTPIPGTPITVAVHYSVSATVGGMNGYTVRAVPATSVDMVSDLVGGQIYLAIPATASNNPSTLIPLDPVAGTLSTAVPAVADPGVLAVSDVGSYLYVGSFGSGTVDRYTLPGLAHDLSIPMGAGASGPLFADEIQVAPGLPHSFAVVRSYGVYGSFTYDVAVFDDATRRINTLVGTASVLTGTRSNRLQWASASTLYAVNGIDSTGPIETVAADASGLAVVASVPTELSKYYMGRIHLDGGLLYSDDGQAFATSPAVSLLGRYVVDPGSTFPRASLPDVASGRMFVAVESNGAPTYLQSYDLATFAPIARINLPGISLAQHPRLVRYGADGLALQASDRVILVNGTFVKP